MDLNSLRAAASAGERFEYVFFWKPDAEPGEGLGPGCLSQWWMQTFEEDGVRYLSAEHYMMAGKARLFGDAEIFQQILASPSPAAVKALGRKVRGFDGATWNAHRAELVTRGNLLKFGQHPDLLAYLLSTGDRVLVEASPLDTIWGIGLSANSPKAPDPLQWRGLNLLGFALMDARARLRARSA